MSSYTPMHEAFLDKTTDWVYTSLSNLTFEEIATKGVVLWCEEHLIGRWTMLGGNKFGFEDGTDAMAFKITFGV